MVRKVYKYDICQIHFKVIFDLEQENIVCTG